MSNEKILFSIIIMSITTFALRYLPFAFEKAIRNRPLFIYLKNNFPVIIMFILVFYAANLYKTSFETKDFSDLKTTLISIFAVTIAHIIFKHYLLSIFIGVLTYMAVLHGIINIF